MDYSNSLRPSFQALTPTELLKQPVTALITVSEGAAKALSEIGIHSVFDLGSSQLFSAARQIREATKIQDVGFVPRFSGDLIDASMLGKKNAEIAASSISVLRQLDDQNAAFIQNALSIITIGELATWPAYNTARAIINDAYGLTRASIINDEERPDELIPIMRKYATERVQYDVIVMDKVLESERFTSAVLKYLTVDKVRESIKALKLTPEESIELEKLLQVLPELKNELLLDGAVDISDVVSAALTTKPAVGAVLTYRQSWYPQGLALGHLLHSMALAPGESTRIAMVDWSRKDSGNLSEDTNQAENLAADVNHTRSIGEVTSAVAKEAQSGFSESNSRADQTQNGTTSGKAALYSKDAGEVSLDKKGLNVDAQFELGTVSTGQSNAKATTIGWASSNSSSIGERDLNATMLQNINDKTQQASNSVRNRRATTVKETSQKESENLSTRVVTNYNHMHALTVQYFEVVQIYKVMLELSKVTPCLFLPMKLVTFTEKITRRYRSVIAAAGLIPAIKALASEEPDQMALEMPGKSSKWLQAGIDSLNSMLGYRSTSPESKIAILPIERNTFNSFILSKAVVDNFSAIVVEIKNGSNEVISIDISLSPAYGNIGINFVVGGKAVNIADVSKIKLSKRPSTSNFEGAIDFGLTNNWYDQRGIAATSYWDATLLATMNVKKDENEVTVYNFYKSSLRFEIIEHLEENALHYSTAIWNSLDAATITTMLSSHTLNGKRLIENIDPVPVSIAGNYIIFRYYGVGKDEWQDFLKEKGLQQPAPLEDTIPLPSAGVFAEAVLGRSNAAEKLDITRFWNWQDSPIPILPAEINPLNAGGKTQADSLATGKLESPVLNIINPPSVPDPTGLASLYSAIGNGNMFRDMSGMAQTSSLLQSAMQAAQSAAANAASSSGEAQKVAANQLTDILKIAAQIAAGGMGIPTGAIGGGGNNTGNTHNLPPTASNKGANINAAKELDEKNRAAAKQNKGTNGNVNEWSPIPDQTNNPNNGLTEPPLVDAGAFPNETVALNGGGGSARNPLGVLTDMILSGTPKNKEVLKIIGDPTGASIQSIDLADLIANHIKKRTSVPDSGGVCVDASYQYFIDALKEIDVDMKPMNIEGRSIGVPNIVTHNGGSLPGLAFVKLYYSDNQNINWQALPLSCRGKGAVGALLYADLIEQRQNGITISENGWPQNMVPGTLLQFWSNEEAFENVRDKGEPLSIGHAPIFLSYKDSDTIIVADQHHLSAEYKYNDKSSYYLKYIIAAKPSKIELIKV